MVPVALALGASIAWGASDFLAGIKTRRLALLWVLLVSQATVLLLVGPLAQRLRDHVTPAGVPVVTMKSRRQSGANASWRAALTQLRTHSYPHDVASPSFEYQGEREQIPRRDLPFGTLRWQGSSGDRAQRPTRSGNPSFDYYKITMPAWAAALVPPPLSPSESAAAEVLGNL